LTPGLTDDQKDKVLDELQKNLEQEQQNSLNPAAEFGSLLPPKSKAKPTDTAPKKSETPADQKQVNVPSGKES
jgi:hypothetical protein